MVGQQELVALAQQGDASAIAILINQASQTKGITATANLKGSCLEMLLVSEQVPEKSTSVRFIYDGLSRLKVPSIKCVLLYGRQTEEQFPSWGQAFELDKPDPSIIFLTPRRVVMSPSQTRPSSPPPSRPPSPPHRREPVSTQRAEKNTSPLQQSVISMGAKSRSTTQVLEKISIPTQSVNTVTPRKYRESKEQKKHRQRIPLLFLGGTSWVAIAVGTVMIGYQLSISNINTSKIVLPLQTIASPLATPPTANSASQKQNVIPTKGKLNLISTDAKTTITIKAVGDIVPGTKQSKLTHIKQKMRMFENVKPYLKGADILFGNFESTLTNYSEATKNINDPMTFAFRTAPSYSKLLKATGFDILNIANNHSFDYSAIGFTDTLNNLQKAGIEYVGQKNQILYQNKKGVVIAFIGFSFLKEHNSIHDLLAAKALIQTARQKAKIIVISVHGGAEGTKALHVQNQPEIFYGENRGNMLLFAHSMIDYGADLILGHGPHVARAMELYKGKLIAYSLGNFLGDGALSSGAELSNSLVLEVKLNPQGDFITGNILPVYIDNKGIPQIDNQFRSIEIIRNLTKTDFPNTPLIIDKNGRLLKQ